MCGIKGVKRPARSRDPLLRSFFGDVCASSSSSHVQARADSRRRGLDAPRVTYPRHRSAPYLAAATTATAATTITNTTTTTIPTNPRPVCSAGPIYYPRLLGSALVRFVSLRQGDREALPPPSTLLGASILRRTMRKFAYLVDLREKGILKGFEERANVPRVSTFCFGIIRSKYRSI